MQHVLLIALPTLLRFGSATESTTVGAHTPSFSYWRRSTLLVYSAAEFSWKTYDHETFMKEQLRRVLSPGCIATDPQSYTSSPVDGMAAVEMIFRDKIDVAYDPKVCLRRRRIEWPSGDPAVRDILISSTGDNDTSVTDLASKLENNRLR